MEIVSGFQAHVRKTMSSESKPRPVRADAARNRSQILETAAQAFRMEGLNVSMDSIARQAGVGPGTLYRHFPTRDALLAVLLLEQHYDELQKKRTLIDKDASDPGLALERWIQALGQWMSAYDGLPVPLRDAWLKPESALGPACEKLIGETGRYLAAAQRAGQARKSIHARDVFLAALAIAWAAGAPSSNRKTRTSLNEVLRSGWRLPPCGKATGT